MYFQCLKKITNLIKQITSQSDPKILEKIVYKRLYEYLMDINLLIEQNSGFKRNDSTVNQLLQLFIK